MKIGTKLFLALAVPITLLILLFGVLDERDSRARSRDELVREGRAIARAVQLATEFALRDRQLADAHLLVDRITGFERVLGIRLFHTDGSLEYQSPDLTHVPTPAPAEVQRALSASPMTMARSNVDGHEVVSYLAPLVASDGTSYGVAQVLQRESFIEEDERASRRSIGVFTAIMVIAVGAILFLVTRATVSAPIADLVRRVRDIGAGEFGAKVRVHRRDELGRLADEFNLMSDKLARMRRSLEAEQEERRRVEISLREAERLASVGRLAAGLAHEIGTPLNVIGGRADLILRRGELKEKDAGNLRIIASQIDRIARIVRGMLDFSRVRELRPAPTAVRAVLERVVEVLAPRFDASAIRLEWRTAHELPEVMAEPDRLEQVFLNVMVNAIDAMPHGGTLAIEVSTAERTPPDHRGQPRPLLVVTLADDGRGIPPENLERVFDPFFTTKEVGAGTGLGLSISYGIVQEHGGWIELESDVGRGTRVTILLPAEPAASEAAGTHAGEPAA